jgi:hypothetical protein
MPIENDQQLKDAVNECGALSRPDMIDVVAALRAWENDGTWARAYAG